MSYNQYFPRKLLDMGSCLIDMLGAILTYQMDCVRALGKAKIDSSPYRA